MFMGQWHNTIQAWVLEACLTEEHHKPLLVPRVPQMAGRALEERILVLVMQWDSITCLWEARVYSDHKEQEATKLQLSNSHQIWQQTSIWETQETQLSAEA